MEPFVPQSPLLGAPPASQRSNRRWLVVGGLALALAAALGVGALIGSTIHPAAAASSPNTASNVYFTPANDFTPARGFATTPNGSSPNNCAVLTVKSVSGATIVATDPNGNSVTIHTTSSTTYTKAGAASTASAVTVGSQIRVRGTQNSDGSLTATEIDIG